MSVGFWLAEVDPLSDSRVFDKAFEMMPEARQKKITALRFDKDKRLSLGAGLLLRHALKAFEISENSSIAENEKGKPFLRDYQNFHFNLSHSGTMVCCAAGTMPLGCDIEYYNPRHIKIAKRFFTKTEQQWLAEAKGAKEETKRFFRLWTLKESFIKATGYGLSFGLERFSVVFKDDRPFLQEEQIQEGEKEIPPLDFSLYTLYEPKGAEGYGTALCLKSPLMALPQAQSVDLSTIL